MALRDEIVQAVAAAPRVGPARWRSRVLADSVLDVLEDRGLLPPPDEPLTVTQPVHTIKDHARLLPSTRHRLDRWLNYHRVGWWEWSAIRDLGDEWVVSMWQHHPQGGPLFVLNRWGQIEPGVYFRSLPPPGRGR